VAGTRVDIRADDVPVGISAKDHAAGPALVPAAAEGDRARGGELLSDQLAQLIVT